MLDLFQLRCFVAVAEELHFGRAARRLNMTQPPLSRQVQLLERAVGASLLARSSRSVRMTAAGEALLAQAGRLLRMAEAVSLAPGRVARGEGGTIRLGFTGGSSYALVPLLVTSVAREMPGVELILREMRSAEQMEALAAGRLDAALVRLPIDGEGARLLPVMREAMVLAAPAGHALVRRRRPPCLPDLQGERLVGFAPDENRFLHEIVTALLRGAEVIPDWVQQVSQVHTALGLVGAGLGVALVPASAGLLGLRGVSLRSLRPAPPIDVVLHYAWREERESAALLRLRTRVLPLLDLAGKGTQDYVAVQQTRTSLRDRLAGTAPRAK